MRFQQGLPLTLLLLLSGCSLPALSDDSFLEGRKLYAEGHYAQAAGLLNSYLIGHPEDARAQYLLGNSFVGLQRNEDAIQHYQQAIKLAPKSAVAAYSRDELAKLQALVPRARDSAQSANAASQDVKTSDSVGSTSSAKSSAFTAVHAVNQQTDAHEKELQAEYEAKIKQVRLDAQTRINRLNQQKKEELSALGRPLWKNGQTYWTPDTEPVNEAYRGRIDDVNKETERKIADLNLECKSRVDKLEQFAVDSSRAYSGRESVGASHSNPASSNLHVHNYEIEGDVSGNPTPLIASPQKMPSTKTSAH
jgi:tetratricopeptide (TPR) repeat protein